MAHEKLTREDCIRLLREKAAALETSGQSRYPQRSDFTDYEVMSIKAFLGPWPRALEFAGLKEPRSDDRLQKRREKRERAKKRLRKLKKKPKLPPKQNRVMINEIRRRSITGTYRRNNRS